MKNIAIPGVFPLVIAALLTYGAIRSHLHYKKWKAAKSRSSRILCVIGAALFYSIALLQLLESFGISFR